MYEHGCEREKEKKRHRERKTVIRDCMGQVNQEKKFYAIVNRYDLSRFEK